MATSSSPVRTRNLIDMRNSVALPSSRHTSACQGTVRCNCSICSKARAWLAAVDAGSFRLLSGADALSDYQFGPHRIHHMFCKTCGVKSFGRGSGPDGAELVAVLVSCLENIPDAELAQLPVMYLDGRNDNFQAPPAETRHL